MYIRNDFAANVESVCRISKFLSLINCKSGAYCILLFVDIVHEICFGGTIELNVNFKSI